jgi:2-polyprenyl-3-methyl-5-hydroxy-6-metoxy-1,4-benzoquinol methylase
VLDAPWGVGYGSALIAEQTQADVVAVDCDPKTILYAQRRYGDIPNLRFLTANLDTDDIEEEGYDAVLCFEGIEHVAKQSEVAKRLSCAASRFGMVVVSTPRRGGPGAGSPFHTHELLRAELFGLFWPFTSSIQMYGQDLLVGDCAPDDSARYYILVGTR